MQPTANRDSPDRSRTTVWTIGHSNQDVAAFLALLQRQGVALVADVRSNPYSRYADQFNREKIQHRLRERQIGYDFLGDLIGGQPQDRRFYDDDGYVRYDALADSEAFRRGIERLLEKAKDRRTALLCSEEDPTGCHRRLLVGRVLAEAGVDVRHIRADGRVQCERDVAEAEEFERNKGQLALFETEEPRAWKSSRSASPRKAPPSSSRP